MISLSIITPTFKREAFLAEAIGSVQKIEGIEWEMLIGDNSPEGSAEAIVRALGDERIRYWKNPQPTGGIPGAYPQSAGERSQGKIPLFSR